MKRRRISNRANGQHSQSYVTAKPRSTHECASARADSTHTGTCNALRLKPTHTHTHTHTQHIQHTHRQPLSEVAVHTVVGAVGQRLGEQRILARSVRHKQGRLKAVDSVSLGCLDQQLQHQHGTSCELQQAAGRGGSGHLFLEIDGEAQDTMADCLLACLIWDDEDGGDADDGQKRLECVLCCCLSEVNLVTRAKTHGAAQERQAWNAQNSLFGSKETKKKKTNDQKCGQKHVRLMGTMKST